VQCDEQVVQQRAVCRIRNDSNKRGENDGKAGTRGISGRSGGILDGAPNVVTIPGHGMAAAQALHKLCEMHDILIKRGAEVRFAILG
jgi:NAD/NADP transhydrogenase beta subunit